MDLVRGYIRDSEEVSHAFTGHKRSTAVESAAAHALGYLVSPFWSAWKHLPISNEVKPYKRYDMNRGAPTHIERPEEAPAQIDMSKRNGKKNVKKAVKKAVGRAMSTVQLRGLRQPGRSRFRKPSSYLRRPRTLGYIRGRNRASMMMSTNTGKKLVKSIVAPATNYAGTYSTGTYCKLVNKGSYNEIHSRVRVAYVTLYYPEGSSTPILRIWLSNGPSNSYGSYFLGGNSDYLAEPVWDILTMWSEFRHQNVCFEFTPRVQGGTSSGFAVTWGFSADANYAQSHSFVHLTSLGNGYQTDEQSIAQMDGSTQFPAWVPTSCYDCTSKLDRKWRYVNGPDQNTYFNPGDSAADQRQTYAGCLFMAGDENYRVDTSEVEEVILGSLYMKSIIGVREFTPVASASVTSERVFRNICKHSHLASFKEKVLALLECKQQKGKLLSNFKPATAGFLATHRNIDELKVVNERKPQKVRRKKVSDLAIESPPSVDSEYVSLEGKTRPNSRASNKDDLSDTFIEKGFPIIQKRSK